MSAVFSAAARIAIVIATVSLSALVLALAWQVFGRYVLNSSPGWTEPVALTLMSIAALTGAAVAVRNETHFAFPMLVETAPRPVKVALKTFARLVALVFGLAMAILGGYLMAADWNVSMAGAPLPEGMAFSGLCIGGAFITLFAFERLITGDPPKEHIEAIQLAEGDA